MLSNFTAEVVHSCILHWLDTSRLQCKCQLDCTVCFLLTSIWNSLPPACSRTEKS